MNPTLLDSEQRYWRRRANRRVRKARWMRNGLRWLAVIALHVAVAAVLVLASVRAAERLGDSDAFRLRRFEIVGARRADAQALASRLEAFRGHSLLQLDLEPLARQVRADPWVRDCVVRRLLPGSVRIELDERRPAALALIAGRAHLVDREGFVIGPTGRGREDDLPLLRGLEGLEGPALASALRRGVDLLLQLDRAVPGFDDEIAEMDLAHPDRLTMRLVAPGPELLLDPERVERNVERYLELRDQIARRIEHARYVDLRWADRIAVLPDERNEPTAQESRPVPAAHRGSLDG